MWVKRILFLGMCVTALLSACGPETLPPDSTLARGQAQPAVQEAASPEPAVIEPAPTAPELEVSPPLTESVPLAEPTTVLSDTSAPVETAASPIIPSLAITDPARVDIFKIADELVEAGDAAFPIQVTLGEGEEAMQIKASKPSRIQLPCFPNALAPYGNQYTCRIGGGMEAHLWIASWGQGLQRLLTDQSMGATAWSSDGSRVAFATLAGQDERRNVPLKILDLNSDEEITVGMMSSPFQMAFTPDDELIYLYDGALHIVAVPRPQSLTEGLSFEKMIPLDDIPDSEAYFEPAGRVAWFRVSPTGEKVAFLRENWGHESGKLSILDWDSEQEYVIDEQVKNFSFAMPSIYAWSPNGDTLAYMTIKTTVEGGYGEETYTHRSELWLVDADGKNRRLLWEVDQPNRSYTAVRWLPNGKAILTSASVEAWSDLVQIVSVKDGQHRDLFANGKWGSLIPQIPGRALALMPNVISREPAVYDVAVLVYPTE